MIDTNQTDSMNSMNVQFDSASQPTEINEDLLHNAPLNFDMNDIAHIDCNQNIIWPACTTGTDTKSYVLPESESQGLEESESFDIPDINVIQDNINMQCDSGENLSLMME